jgi:hypothetical protein
VDDIEAIRRVQAQYGRAADMKDWDLLRPTVTDDFACDTGAGGRGATTGIDAFVARVASNPAVTVHHALMPEIELLADDSANGIWAVHLFARTPDGSTVNAFGHYHNRYRKVGGRWRLSSLTLVWLHREIQAPEAVAASR